MNLNNRKIKDGYKYITLDNLKNIFQIEKRRNHVELRYRKSVNTINIKIPFELNEKVASLAGLMPDGSLIKDLRRIYFHQKKDYQKIILFKRLLIDLFSLKNKVFIRPGNNCFDAYTNSQTLVRFLYHILNFSKSDEQTRVPRWVFESPLSVKYAYLREAFAMEGTVLKRLSEIRFITKDYKYAKDLKNLLKQVGITPTINKRIGGTPLRNNIGFQFMAKIILPYSKILGLILTLIEKDLKIYSENTN